MKRYITIAFVFLFLLLLSAACHQRYEQDMKQAIRIAENQPDSAMKMLERLDRQGFSDSERALYALAYTLSQDKSGLDVDNDSLIRTAYDYYVQDPKDSLYGKCMYYMGKYYMLNDSMAQATYCFNRAEKAAEHLRDTASQCLALEKWAITERGVRPQTALKRMDKAVQLYTNYQHAITSNTILMILNKANCMALAGNAKEAFKTAESLMPLAMGTHDSMLIAEVYHGMAAYTMLCDDYPKAVHWALAAFHYAPEIDTSKILALAECYERTGEYDKCVQLLESWQPKRNIESYTAYYMLHHMAIKRGDKDAALAYADSAYNYLELVCKQSIEEKERYYSDFSRETAKKAYAEGRNAYYRAFIILIIIFSVLITVAMLQIYRINRKKHSIALKAQIEHNILERKLHAQEKENAEKLHQEEIKHQKAQLELLSSILARKVEILNKFSQIEESPVCHLKIEPSDWKEIEEFLESTQGHFVSRIKAQYTMLNEKDIQLLMLLRLGLPTKTLANIYGISETSVKQKLFLFKKKIGIEREKLSLRTLINKF